MEVKVNGIVLRAVHYGESDCLLHVLTAENGHMVLSAKGGRSRRSKLYPYTHMLLYGEFTAHERNGRYWIREISPHQDFYAVDLGIERLALITYLCELLCDVTTEETPDHQLLRLALNTVYLLTRTDKPLNTVKGIFELRCAAELGFCPALESCAGCGCETGDPFYLLPDEGILLCGNCVEESAAEPDNRRLLAVDPDIVRAMRHVTEADMAKIYSFRLPDELQKRFNHLAEIYLLAQIDRSFKTLEYYKTVYSPDSL